MQCKAAAVKSGRILACIRKGIYSRDKTIILPLYKTLVWQHLEYSIKFWSPILRKDVLKLKRVQRSATKLIRGLEGLNYEERLQALDLFSLEQRRLRGDMIAIYKYLNGDLSIEKKRFTRKECKRTQGHTMRLKEK